MTVNNVHTKVSGMIYVTDKVNMKASTVPRLPVERNDLE